MSKPARIRPPDHIPFRTNPTALTIHMKGMVVVKGSDKALALSMYDQCLVAARDALAALPKESPSETREQCILDVVFAQLKLSGVKWQFDDMVGAQTLLEEAVELSEGAVGPSHPRLADVLAELGWVLMVRCRYAAADVVLERALSMREELFGPDDGCVAMTLSYMGKSCVGQGNYKRAKALLKRAVAIGELHVVPSEYPEPLSMALSQLSHVYYCLKDYVRGQSAAERMLALREQFLGPNHPNVAVTLIKLAACLEGQHKLSEAEPLYERAVSIYERLYGPHHTELAAALGNLGNMLRQKGEFDRAKLLVERALAIDEKEFGTVSVGCRAM
jgi:tetratricopeptide (TPR) repeat protein